MAPENSEPRFLFRGNDFEADSGLAPDPFDELAAIDRAAARFGRDRTGEADPSAPEFFRADRQRGDGAVHCGFADLAARRHALAEADDAGKGVNHGKPVLRRTSDEEPAIIGAEIDGAISMAAAVPTVRNSPFEGRGRLGSRRLRSRYGLLRHYPNFSYISYKTAWTVFDLTPLYTSVGRGARTGPAHVDRPERAAYLAPSRLPRRLMVRLRTLN